MRKKRGKYVVITATLVPEPEGVERSRLEKEIREEVKKVTIPWVISPLFLYDTYFCFLDSLQICSENGTIRPKNATYMQTLSYKTKIDKRGCGRYLHGFYTLEGEEGDPWIMGLQFKA